MTRSLVCTVAVLAMLMATVVNAGVPNAAQKAAGNVTSFDDQTPSYRPVYRAPMVTTAPATTTERSFSYEPAPAKAPAQAKKAAPPVVAQQRQATTTRRYSYQPAPTYYSAPRSNSWSYQRMHSYENAGSKASGNYGF
jgi:hypothetical protein